MRNNVLKAWCAEFAQLGAVLSALIHRALLAEDEVRLFSSPDHL
ncbi:hypothetical protein J2X90_002185 [Variovorax paradoxus]|nr:hypothetical protein [Variovorax paradoxus]MDP9932622.1 hypothetical protein [Variovorax paradoxus]MDQ0024387.1 hypothetical protein [Variovorax paradoxus]